MISLLISGNRETGPDLLEMRWRFVTRNGLERTAKLKFERLLFGNALNADRNHKSYFLLAAQLK